jgi:hypothetical protein
MDLSLRVLFEYDCGSHKVYLNFWVTDFGGCDRVQIKVNISIFGWDSPSPPIGARSPVKNVILLEFYTKCFSLRSCMSKTRGQLLSKL